MPFICILCTLCTQILRSICNFTHVRVAGRLQSQVSFHRALADGVSKAHAFVKKTTVSHDSKKQRSEAAAVGGSGASACSGGLTMGRHAHRSDMLRAGVGACRDCVFL
jgi:hypothetical protein